MVPKFQTTLGMLFKTTDHDAFGEQGERDVDMDRDSRQTFGP